MGVILYEKSHGSKLWSLKTSIWFFWCIKKFVPLWTKRNFRYFSQNAGRGRVPGALVVASGSYARGTSCVCNSYLFLFSINRSLVGASEKHHVFIVIVARGGCWWEGGGRMVSQRVRRVNGHRLLLKTAGLLLLGTLADLHHRLAGRVRLGRVLARRRVGQRLVLPLVHRAPACVHEEVAHRGRLQPQLPSDRHLHLFRRPLGLLHPHGKKYYALF